MEWWEEERNQGKEEKRVIKTERGEKVERGRDKGRKAGRELNQSISGEIRFNKYFYINKKDDKDILGQLVCQPVRLPRADKVSRKACTSLNLE